MRERSTRQTPAGRRTGAAALVTALVAALLVVVGSGTTTGAEPVNAKIATSCTGRDKATNDTLGLAKGLIGSDRVAVDVLVTGGNVPATAGLEQDIDAAFNWSATMDQTLIDKAAGLIPAITIADINGRVITYENRKGLTQDLLHYPLSVAAGTYLARIATENGTLTKKFVVVK